jgi:hypothetical protein
VLQFRALATLDQEQEPERSGGEAGSGKREAGSGRGLGFMAISKGQALVTDPKHWRDRAEEARLLAHDMKDTQSREAMLRIAKDYDYLAERAAQRARDRANSK